MRLNTGGRCDCNLNPIWSSIAGTYAMVVSKGEQLIRLHRESVNEAA
jgi:hypothetical protein